MFNWRDYLALANTLRGAGAPDTRDARLRSAISRAYYATFHELESLVFEGDPRPRVLSFHEKLIQATYAEGVREEVRVLGVKLERLKKARIDADYVSEFPGNLEAKATEVCEVAMTTVTAIDDIQRDRPLDLEERQTLKSNIHT